MVDALTAAGGLPAWESWNDLRFDKTYTLYHEDGREEQTVTERHHYRRQPPLVVIRSRENDELTITRWSEGQYEVTFQGKERSVDSAALTRSINAARYAVSMPFGLADPATTIKGSGADTLPDGSVVDVLSVSYPSSGPGRTSSEPWRYGISRTTKRIAAAWVTSSDHANLITNDTYVTASGLLFNGRRTSYRVDSMGRILYRRASYVYRNYQVD